MDRQTFFQIHKEYLQSETWKFIRSEVLKRDKHIYQFCKNTEATDVHHKTYVRWQQEKLSDLISVCRPCHTAHHNANAHRNVKGKDIGSRNLYARLTQNHKNILIKEFKLSGLNDLYSYLCINFNKKLAKRAGKLLGFFNVYSQCPKLKPLR